MKHIPTLASRPFWDPSNSLLASISSRHFPPSSCGKSDADLFQQSGTFAGGGHPPSQQPSSPIFIPFPEVRKLAQLSSQGDSHSSTGGGRNSGDTMSQSILAVAMGYFLSSSYTLMSVGKFMESFALMRRLRYHRSISRASSLIRRNPWAECLPFCLCFMGFRRVWGVVPVEWLIFAAFSFRYVGHCFQVWDDMETARVWASLLTVSVVLWMLVPGVVLACLADVMSFAFVADELRRYHKSSVIFWTCLLASIPAMALSIHGYHRYCRFASIAAALDAASLLMIACLAVFQFASAHVTSLFELFGILVPTSPPLLFVSDITSESFRVEWTCTERTEVSSGFWWPTISKSSIDYYRLEFNGKLLARTGERYIVLKDLSPEKSVRVRVFAIIGNCWVSSLPLYVRTAPESARTFKLSSTATEDFQSSLISPDDREIVTLQNELNNMRMQRLEVDDQVEDCRTAFLKESEELHTAIATCKDQVDQVVGKEDLQKSRIKLKELEESRKLVDGTRLALENDLNGLRSDLSSRIAELDRKREEVDTFHLDTSRISSELKESRRFQDIKVNNINEDIDRLNGITRELSTAIARKESEREVLLYEIRKRTAEAETMAKRRADHLENMISLQSIRKEQDDFISRQHRLIKEAADENAFLDRQIQQVNMNKARLLGELEASEKAKDNRFTDLIDPAGESIDDLLDAINYDRLHSDGENDTITISEAISFDHKKPAATFIYHPPTSLSKWDRLASQPSLNRSIYQQMQQDSSSFFSNSNFFSPAPLSSIEDSQHSVDNVLSRQTVRPVDSLSHLRPNAPAFKPSAIEANIKDLKKQQ